MKSVFDNFFSAGQNVVPPLFFVVSFIGISPTVDAALQTLTKW